MNGGNQEELGWRPQSIQFWRPGNSVIKDHGTQKDDKATKV